MKYLLDSNVLIYAARPAPPYTLMRTWLERADACVSAITLVEVLGFANLHLEDELFFSIAFDFLPQRAITTEVLKRAVQVRQQFRLKTPDAVVAATALVHGLELVTADAAFARVAGLTVINPLLTA